jgi:Kdo2-lipid IVA 3' secondary acyltransferase
MRIEFQHTGLLVSWLLRGIASTLRWEIDDRAGLLDPERTQPLIWAFWHNRLLVIPYVKQRWLPQVPGCVLTSASRDGQIIADVCEEFWLQAARGSSSKPQQGMSALIKLAAKIKAGFDIGITPDGPRGPIYELHPGLLKLSQLSRAPIVPVQVHYESAWRLPSWDRFQIPKPFSRVRIVCGPRVSLPREAMPAEFDQALANLQTAMRAGNDSLTEQ